MSIFTIIILITIDSRRDSIETGERESKRINQDLSDLVKIQDKRSLHYVEKEAEKDENEADKNLQGLELMKKLERKDAKAEEYQKSRVAPTVNDQVKFESKAANDKREADNNLQGLALMKKLAEEDAVAEKNRRNFIIPPLNIQTDAKDEANKAANDKNERGKILPGDRLMEKLSEENGKAKKNRQNNVIPLNIQNKVQDNASKATNNKKEAKEASKNDERIQGEDLMNQLEKEDKIAEKERKTDEKEAIENQEAVNKGKNSADNNLQNAGALTKKSEQETMIERLKKQNEQENKLLVEMIEKLRNGEI